MRSSKVGRLKRTKPGYYNPPSGRPLFVPGFHWLQVLVIGRKGPPTRAHMVGGRPAASRKVRDAPKKDSFSSTLTRSGARKSCISGIMEGKQILYTDRVYGENPAGQLFEIARIEIRAGDSSGTARGQIRWIGEYGLFTIMSGAGSRTDAYCIS